MDKEVFHTPLGISLDPVKGPEEASWETLRQHVHIILVQPEEGGNIGAIARARLNMGILGKFIVVGTPDRINGDSERWAKHAKSTLSEIQCVENLNEAFLLCGKNRLVLGTSSRVGSSQRPHPVLAATAIQRATERMETGDLEDLLLVFGRESNGLTNEEMSLCDWIVSIPTSEQYDSLNLAQAVLIFCYEVNQRWQRPAPSSSSQTRPSQRQRLVTHFIQLAEACGFILPGDPFKMRPRLETLLAQLPPHFEGAETLHGLLDQAARSARKGEPDYKGRYRKWTEEKNAERQTQ